jgi:hypothetical protein
MSVNVMGNAEFFAVILSAAKDPSAREILRGVRPPGGTDFAQNDNVCPFRPV